jgi:hypothetical protein
MTSSDGDPKTPISPIELGSVLVSLLDPTRGEEVAFHRWYERDHFYSGCMIGPWFFAGRRFVATRRLKDLRVPAETPVIDDIRRGSYLALYWMLAGHHEEAESWAVAQVNQLIEEDRMLPSRKQAHAGFYRFRYGVFRDQDGVPPELALDHPYPGLGLVMVDRAEGVSADVLDAWLREEYLPRSLAGGSAAMTLCLEPVPLPDDAPAYVARPVGLERRALHLYFFEEDPAAGFHELVERQDRALRAEGLGAVTYAAPFIPTVPGSDRYADELW